MKVVRYRPLRRAQRGKGPRRKNAFRPVRLVRRPRQLGGRRFSPGMLLGGLAAMTYGLVQAYLHPFWTYSNYWGGAVFAPLVVLVGLAIALLSPFVLISDRSVQDNPAERVRFPHEDVSRPWDGTQS